MDNTTDGKDATTRKTIQTARDELAIEAKVLQDRYDEAKTNVEKWQAERDACAVALEALENVKERLK